MRLLSQTFDCICELNNLINTVVGAQNCLQQVNVNHLNSTVNDPSNLFSQYEHKRLGISVWLVLKSPWQWLISSFLPPVHRWDHTQPNKFSVAQIFAAKRLIVVHGWEKCLFYLIYFFICHIHNYTEYNQQWNEMCSLQWKPIQHTWSSGQPTLRRPGSSWGFSALLKGLTSVVDNSCRSRDSNPQPRVTSPTRYPLGHGCP